MKYIKKQIALEPQTLLEYRERTPNASYGGFGDTDSLLKKALLREQGYICGYCMKKLLDETQVSVEHYISQKKHNDSNFTEYEHKKYSLEYTNMIGVCKNNGQHCDKSRGNIPFKALNPHNRSCERYIQYSLFHKVISNNNADVDFDIDTLKLNCQPLKDLRNEFWTQAYNKLKKEHSKGTWTKELIEAEKQLYINKSKDKYHPFCNYIIARFDHLLSKSKYK